MTAKKTAPPLIDSRATRGAALVDRTPLLVRRVAHAVMVPANSLDPTGVYDAMGIAVTAPPVTAAPDTDDADAAADTTPTLTIPAHRLNDAREDLEYLYLGEARSHLSELLFTTLARAWPLPLPLPPALRLVVTDPAPLDELFRNPAAVAVLRVMGITRGSFVTFRHPTRFRELIVPEPAFRSNAQGRAEFVRMAHVLRREIVQRPAMQADETLVFVTDTKRTGRPDAIVNLDDFVAELERLGVEIVDRATLSIAAEIGLWGDRRLIATLAGPALLPGVFVPRAGYVALSTSRVIDTNLAIIDLLNRHQGRIVHPGRALIPVKDDNGARAGFRLRDAVTTARAFHALMVSARDTVIAVAVPREMPDAAA